MKTVLINGSPKKKLSVSSYLLGMLKIGIKGEVVKEQVRNKSDYARVLANIQDADAVVFVLPLYVDGVPAHILAFMKEMQDFCKDSHTKVRVYVLSNSGFIEGNQNKPLMMVFENFCKRCDFEWCGGIGIGGGVMLNVLRIIFFVYIGIFLLNCVLNGMQTGNWLSVDIIKTFMKQIAVIIFFNLGVFYYGGRMRMAINREKKFEVKFTRVLLPSFVFIFVADVFFVIISFFQGGLFRGWLSKK